MGSDLVMSQKYLTQVWSGQFFVARFGSGRVSYLWFGFEFGKFPLKMLNFSSDRVGKYPGQRRVGHLFTKGQKY